MAAMQNREVAEKHVVAVLERDGLIGDPRVFGNRTPGFPAA